ncbi:MAG: hypothetical protein WD335_01470 [Candidatus Paceibacterota bacterium]
MPNFTYNLIRFAAAAAFGLALLALPGYAGAQTSPPITVDFETNPLFDAGNFLPGDAVSKTVTVTNNSDTSQTVETAAANADDNDGLGDQLDMTITSPGDSHFDDTLGNFLTAGDVDLSELLPGDTVTYTFEVYFEETTGNAYQGKSLSFDVCVGFVGGQMSCSYVPDDPNGGGDDNGDGDDNNNELETFGQGGGDVLPDRDGDGVPDDKDKDPDDPRVAGDSTTTVPTLSSLLIDLDGALRNLLTGLGGGFTPEPQVAGASTEAPGLPNTGGEGQGVRLIAVLLSLLATGLVGYRLASRIYRRRQS